MSTSPTPHGGARALVVRALEVQLGRLDQLRARAWITVGVGTVAVDIVALIAGNRGEGVVGIGLGAAVALWFALRPFAPATASRAVGVADLVIELTFAPCYLALMAIFAPALRTAVSPGPGLLLAGALIVSIFRLEPIVTFAIGALGGVLIFIARVTLVIPALRDAGFADEAPFMIVDHAIASSSFVFAGMVSAFVSWGLQGALGGAVRIARERDLFGKYRLEHELGAGGMGIVWSATYCPEGGFERPAAVKLVHPHLAREPAFIDAFRREAELCARLVHPNVVQVFDFGRADDRWFLAMERIDGVTLRELMKRARREGLRAPPAVVVGVGRALLSALSYAHRDAKGGDGAPLHVIHRDVAAANVLIGRGGLVKLTDFGIARATGESGVVVTDTVAGHADTMSPEQLAAAPLDERTDLFSCAVLLWELLCGRALFKRANEAATIHAVTHDDVPTPSAIDPSLSAWDAFFARALARDREQRFASARAMADALAPLGPGGDEDIARFVTTLGEGDTLRIQRPASASADAH